LSKQIRKNINLLIFKIMKNEVLETEFIDTNSKGIVRENFEEKEVGGRINKLFCIN
jgi:hypothetical protein